jgi:pilus assembly protein Flp/PilA
MSNICWAEQGVVFTIRRSDRKPDLTGAEYEAQRHSVRKNDFAFIPFTIWSQTMKFLDKKLREFISDEQGATAVEYGLFVALIAAVIVALVKTLGTKISAAFTTINNQL